MGILRQRSALQQVVAHCLDVAAAPVEADHAMKACAIGKLQRIFDSKQRNSSCIVGERAVLLPPFRGVEPLATLRQRFNRKVIETLFAAMKPYILAEIAGTHRPQISGEIEQSSSALRSLISDEVERSSSALRSLISDEIERTRSYATSEIRREIGSRDQAALEYSFGVWSARSPGDMLSDWEIGCFTEASQSIPGDPAKAEENRTSYQALSIPLFEKVIGDARSVLEIGVAVGYMLHLMAKAHPDVQFTGVDLWGNVVELNERLLLPNFTVKQGYALQLMEAGLTADIVHFGSTAARIKQAELKRYLRSIPKYVIFNEPLFRMPNGEIPDPDAVGEKSIPMIVYPVFAGDRYGGLPPCLCHNYRALVEEAGFNVIHYEKIYDPKVVSGIPRVMLVGKRRGS